MPMIPKLGGMVTYLISRSRDKLKNISTTVMPMTTKLRRVATYTEEF